MNEYFIHDARTISQLPLKSQVDLIITSPPYFDMKDYGSDNQIGFGQDYESYLNDLETVFSQCAQLTKETGSLWIIIDILRINGEIKLLPFDVLQKVQNSGWQLQDILIWEKDKTVPYSHRGQMRNIFEYILFFTKSPSFKFYRERITSVNDLKEWWQKYPERYSPNGKSPTNIWEFPIPVQGKNYIKHFCPLPEDLIERIIHLCSDPSDTILDPFAGTGAVLSAAYRLHRNYIGCDLNRSYRKKFLEYIQTISPVETDSLYKSEKEIEQFSKTIQKLRMLKFPKTLYKQIEKSLPATAKGIQAIIAIPKLINVEELPKNKFMACKYVFITADKAAIPMDKIEGFINKAPLSKYGIQAEVLFVEKTDDAATLFHNAIDGLWHYDNGKTYEPGRKVNSILETDIKRPTKTKIPAVYSTLDIKAEELIW